MDSLWIGKTEKGALLYQGSYSDGLREGLWIWNHETGHPKRITEFKRGMRHGKEQVYTSDGRLEQTGSYANDQEEGTWYFYYPHGAKAGTYRKKNGQFDGPYERYHLNGKIQLKGSYSKGGKSGTWEYFNSDGKWIKRVFFQKGVVVDTQTPGR
jgi:antitoxin component YwqK of YwqJK toxin-antitoxin module